MANRFTYLYSGFSPLGWSKKALVSLSLVVGITSASGTTLAIAATAAEPTSQKAEVSRVEAMPEAASTHYLPNGVYLYGQSKQPEQIGNTYLVFEVKNDQVIGAFYMPRSSFDCVYGNFQAEELALTVVDSYERTAHPYAIALKKDYSVARAGNNPTEKTTIGLDGLQPIATVSDNDRRILGVCKANYQNSGNH
ncbi:MAG: hypothetical protein KME16_20735 [Scytolyngbya sp. HA4215-MV1]|nr:hypothetical protein [Scytolyngbya sp. HA4215-MV1]